ncbi:hypothetical protein [Streptomyces platensis]|uniref:hypothetical protein n=1 Tax=Streptomyces platensis TaxID=58346 RepID=UPI00386307EB
MTRAVALVCTPNASPAPSSSQLLADQIMTEFTDLGVSGETIPNAVHLSRLLNDNPYPPS